MPAYTKNRLMSWSDNKELLSRVDTIGVLSQPQKTKKKFLEYCTFFYVVYTLILIQYFECQITIKLGI